MSDRTKATIWHRADCNRVYVSRVSGDGLTKDEWVFGFLPDGTIYLRGLFHGGRRTRRHKWVWEMARCWFSNATDEEARDYLPDDRVPLPTDALGPLVAHIAVRRMPDYRGEWR